MNGTGHERNGTGHERDGMGWDMNEGTDERAHEQGGNILAGIKEAVGFLGWNPGNERCIFLTKSDRRR